MRLKTRARIATRTLQRVRACSLKGVNTHILTMSKTRVMMTNAHARTHVFVCVTMRGPCVACVASFVVSFDLCERDCDTMQRKNDVCAIFLYWGEIVVIFQYVTMRYRAFVDIVKISLFFNMLQHPSKFAF